MTAFIEIDADNDLVSIAESAGQPDVDKRHYASGSLYVEGVTQAALDAAFLAYDRKAYLTAQLIKEVDAEIDRLRAIANSTIAPLQYAVDIDEATAEEEATLKRWKKFRVDLSRIPDQAGYPEAITWPSAD